MSQKITEMVDEEIERLLFKSDCKSMDPDFSTLKFDIYDLTNTPYKESSDIEIRSKRRYLCHSKKRVNIPPSVKVGALLISKLHNVSQVNVVEVGINDTVRRLSGELENTETPNEKKFVVAFLHRPKTMIIQVLKYDMKYQEFIINF